MTAAVRQTRRAPRAALTAPMAPPNNTPPLPLRPNLPRRVAELRPDQIAASIASWRNASPALDALLKAGTEPPEALRRLALTLWSAGDPTAASAMLTVAAALAPECAPLWLDLGHTLQGVGDLGEALACLTYALALDSTPARAWLALAVIANELGDTRRAEGAFLEARSRDRGSHEAAFGLGLICFEQRRYAESAKHWRDAVANGCDNPMVQAGLGQSLFFLGDFKEAAKALQKHIERGGGDAKVIQRHALARFLEISLGGDFERAYATYRAAAGEHADSLPTVARAAFHILSAYGYGETALRIGRELLAGEADDPIHRYLLAAVAGDSLAKAPQDYVIAYFDRFAEVFDKQLIDVLQYRVPEKLSRMIAASGTSFARALDLGCGTGLAGPMLRPVCERLIGVDLAPKMLSRARERGHYDELIETEIVAYLENTKETFDLLMVADTLVYFGDLEPFFRAAARVMAPGAILAFNIETTRVAPYALLPSGRFAHSPDAVVATASPWFTPTARRRAFLRMEAHERVHGELVLLARNGD